MKSRFRCIRRLAMVPLVVVLHGSTSVLLMASSAAIADNALLTRIPEQPMAPGFDLADSDGRQHRLDDMRGKTVIVNFWATWCPPCRAEMPSMQRAWKQIQDEDILILAVNVGEDAATVDQFAEQTQVDFPLPMDIDSKVLQQWPMTGLPTTFVVDPRGRLVYRAQGEREWDDPSLLDLVRALNR